MTVAALVHLNGPPGVGKSTIAAGLVERRPLALRLDVDVLRTQLGRWEEMAESKQVARDLAFEMAALHLRAGRDVVLPQLVVRPEVVARLEGIAAGEALHEVVLLADPQELVRRLASSARVGAHPRDAFTLEELAAQIADATGVLRRYVASRPRAHLLDVTGMDPARAVEVVAQRLGW